MHHNFSFISVESIMSDENRKLISNVQEQLNRLMTQLADIEQEKFVLFLFFFFDVFECVYFFFSIICFQKLFNLSVLNDNT